MEGMDGETGTRSSRVDRAPCVPAPSHSALIQAWGVGPALSPPFCRWGDGGWRKKSIHVTQSPPPADRPDALQTPLSG